MATWPWDVSTPPPIPLVPSGDRLIDGTIINLLSRRYSNIYPVPVFGIPYGDSPANATRDATAAIQAALDYYGYIDLGGPERVYQIRRTLTLDDDGGKRACGIRGGTIYMPSTYFNNANIDISHRYGTNSVGIKASGSASDYDDPIENVTLLDVNIVGSFVDGIYNIPVFVRNAVNALVQNVRVSGFAVGRGICLATCRGNTRVIGSRVFDWYTNIDWGSHANAQLTGFELDNDVVDSRGSTGVIFDDCKTERLITGPVAKAAQGDQSDGFNIIGQAALGAHATQGTQLNNCSSRFVGDGFDSSGGQGDVVVNFVAEDCTNFGMKIPHGAKYGRYSNCVLRRIGIFGLAISSSSSGATTNLGFNNILIEDIDPDNLTVSETACIAITEDTNLCDRNIFDNITCRPGTYGKYIIMTRNSVGGDNYVRGLFPTVGASGWTNITPGTEARLHLTAIDATDVKVSLSGVQAIDNVTPEAIIWDSEQKDTRGEFATGTGLWTCQLPGRYEVLFYARTAAAVNGADHVQQVKNGSTVLVETDFRPSANAAFTFPPAITEFNATEGDTVGAFAGVSSGSYNMTANAGLAYMIIRPSSAGP